LCKNGFSAAVFGAAVFFAQQKTKAVQKCLFAKHSKKRRQCQNVFGAKIYFGVHFPKENFHLVF